MGSQAAPRSFVYPAPHGGLRLIHRSRCDVGGALVGLLWVVVGWQPPCPFGESRSVSPAQVHGWGVGGLVLSQGSWK